MLNKNSANPYANTPGRLARAANAGRSDFYIYVLTRHTGEVVYVGKGRGKRAFRDFTRGGENFFTLGPSLRRTGRRDFLSPSRASCAKASQSPKRMKWKCR